MFSDVRIDTTKSGCWRETDIVEGRGGATTSSCAANVVLDTVMLAAAIAALALDRNITRPAVAAGIMITPNLPEAAALLDAPHARTEQEMLAGRALLAMGCEARY